MPPDDDEDALARFQTALMTILSDGLGPEETRARLEADPNIAPFVHEVSTIDSRALGIAVRVTKKYARREG